MLLQGLRLPQLRLGPSVLPAAGGRIPYLHPVKSVQDFPGSGLNPKPSYIYIDTIVYYTHTLSICTGIGICICILYKTQKSGLNLHCQVAVPRRSSAGGLQAPQPREGAAEK